MNKVVVDNKIISNRCTPYLIAEISCNHNGSLPYLLKTIDAAKKSGADAVKIQTYTADTMTIDSSNPDFKIKQGLWKGKTLYQLYEEAHTPFEWHKEIFAHAKKIGITCFSTPFDETAVDLLEELETPAYKIASFEAIDLPLIKYVSATKKPLIISTGMASKEEIDELVVTAKNNGCSELILLHCISGYPAPTDEFNLKTIPDMLARYQSIIGLSDHSKNNLVAITSVALGASVIEKHFTLDKRNGSHDSEFSIEPDDFYQLRMEINAVWKSLGDVCYHQKDSEKTNVQFRRSLYFIKNLKKGETINTNHIRRIRPGYGLHPKFADHILGKIAKVDIFAGTPVGFDLVE